MNGHTRNQLITEFLMHYLKTGSEDDMKAADIIADEVFEHTLKRIDRGRDRYYNDDGRRSNDLRCNRYR